MAKKISPQESKAIELLRFSLVFLIVFGHMNPNTVSIKSATFPLFSSYGISNTIAIGLSYILAHVAVLTYFMISGYLFWSGIEGWNWGVFLKKLKSRSRSLLLPYVLWNLISIGSFVALILFHVIRDGEPLSNVSDYLRSVGISGFWDYCVWGAYKTNWLGMSIPNTGPFVISLWFVRDLMVVVLCAPVLYWVFKKTKIWGLLFLLFCYVSKIWPQIHGFSIDAFFFFGLGLYISMYGRSLIEVTEKIKLSAFIISLGLFLILLYYGGVKTQEGRYIFPIFAVGCCWLYIKLANTISNRPNFELPILFAKSSFFIYLLHACPFAKTGSVISFINTIIFKLIERISAPWIIYYLISPFIVVAFCIFVYSILQKIAPTLCKALCGDRVLKVQQIKK